MALCIEEFWPDLPKSGQNHFFSSDLSLAPAKSLKSLKAHSIEEDSEAESKGNEDSKNDHSHSEDEMKNQNGSDVDMDAPQNDDQAKQQDRDLELDKESWLERENIHLETKLKKANDGLNLQRKMTKHYAQKNKLACAKLKEALMEIKNLKREKEHDSLGFLAESSQQVSKIL